jgi:hypothetical protein
MRLRLTHRDLGWMRQGKDKIWFFATTKPRKKPDFIFSALLTISTLA